MFLNIASSSTGKWSIWKKHKIYLLVPKSGRQKEIAAMRLCAFCTENIFVTANKYNLCMYLINDTDLTLMTISEKRILADLDNPPIGILFKDSVIYILHYGYMQIYKIINGRLQSAGVETSRI